MEILCSFFSLSSLQLSHVPPQEHLRWTVFVPAPIDDGITEGSGVRRTWSATSSASRSRGSLAAPTASFRCSGSGGRLGGGCAAPGGVAGSGCGEATGICDKAGERPGDSACADWPIEIASRELRAGLFPPGIAEFGPKLSLALRSVAPGRFLPWSIAFPFAAPHPSVSRRSRRSQAVARATRSQSRK